MSAPLSPSIAHSSPWAGRRLAFIYTITAPGTTCIDSSADPWFANELFQSVGAIAGMACDVRLGIVAIADVRMCFLGYGRGMDKCISFPNPGVWLLAFGH